MYIDGFNLYFGMTEKWKDIKWLDIYSLANDLLKPGQQLVEVKYFTSRISNDPNKQKRQTTYLEAIQETGAIIIYGQYQHNTQTCRRCGDSWASPKEKMTDVNIATHLIMDAHLNHFDKAILISGDSDLVPPIAAVQHHFKPKEVIVAFPPNRHNNKVKHVAAATMTLGRKTLKQNQLPLKITKPNGYILEKPNEW